jgi:SpoVK/Ycf46/Vps4 family AAA+-type ATPase
MDDALEQALTRAIEAAPGDIVLKLHLAQLLLDHGAIDRAVSVAADALAIDPTSAQARAIMAAALAPAAPAAVPTVPAPAEPATAFDWNAAESEIGHIAAPMFVSDDDDDDDDDDDVIPNTSQFSVESSTITLADVGGMTSVKERLNAAYLAPLRNPELRKLYGKSLRGGLLMYGPPGCGKTYLARALAGELNAQFLSASLADILDPFIGQSERNVHELFQIARRAAPVVLFLDEIDALGQRRSALSGQANRGTVNQLLTELDGIDGSNEGVFVLAATNQPWDIDPALRRPGRLDRTVLVLPPDREAREAIFRSHLSTRPIEAIDLAALANSTEGFSGADIAYVCEVAAERALTDSANSGVVRLIGMADVTAAVRDVQPSTKAWLSSARNVVLFGDDDGTYAELKAYLKKVKRL